MKIGIIGGSGLYALDELEVTQRQAVDTPWGKPSDQLVCGSLNGCEVTFIARHGELHHIPPHRVNYRANLAALQAVGVEAVLAVNVVGGINGEMCPGDLVIPDQVIDYTWSREHTYSDGAGAALQHVDFTEPYDKPLRETLLKAAIASGLPVHGEGVHGVTQGPRLETAAEIRRMANDGCDIVGMTGMPEAALARELGLPYACLALVVNMAAGLAAEPISMEKIESMMALRMPVVRRLLASACSDLS